MRRKKAKEFFVAVKTQHVKVNFLILPTAINKPEIDINCLLFSDFQSLTDFEKDYEECVSSAVGI